MRVLVACENSGVVSKAFRDRGHTAFSMDLLETTGDPLWHIKGDVHYILDSQWDLLIAHPPCTYLSVSGMHWTTRGFRDPKLTVDALELVSLLMGLQIPKICIENPVSIISSRIRKPDQIIQPYEFGHDASKKTCLWLKGLPKLVPTQYVEPRIVEGKKRWSNQTDSGQNRLGPSEDRWKERSKTYQGIADAMAAQWG